nr:glycoside hydrolase family 5 subfamily 2 [Necydalis major]
MNSFFIFVCWVLLSFSLDSSFSKDALLDPVSKHGYLSVKGINLVDQYGVKVQLKGMSLAWSVWWPEFFNQDTVDGVHNFCHSNVIRAAMAVDTKDGGYLKDPKGQMKLIETVIEAAIKDDMYVIVDWHQQNAYTYVKEAKQFFSKISKKYGSYPNIIYETFNEPVDVSWSHVLKPYHEEIIKTIRANDPNNVIVLGNPMYSTYVEIAATDPIMGQNNIMYSLHFYTGTDKQALRDQADYALNKGLPIFVTQYGIVNPAESDPVDLNESRIWWSWMDKNNLSYVNYDISDASAGSSALVPGTTAQQVCQPEFLTESGRLAVEQIKK